MKWYRYVHSVLFVASFIPLVLSLWPFWQGILLPLIVLIPFSINEIVIDRREKRSAQGKPGQLSRQSKLAHAYRD
ncbi:hypothetical protein [Paenarthrobacter nitroguajacolicus]|uniref:hypothetical protein n=1 Tax=Paenarthrobacter nitroguajacolicus TaxID=211146 RepID=UPI00285EC551|nr:hypothetical protein [Paenarthrobacter nitroguajacolicus]MDR6640627.1 hypothetical protein [Paenarthrobacter nitroguajacolicus]